MENRIEQKMLRLKQKGKKAFITYMMAGLPDMEKCKSLIQAQEQAGDASCFKDVVDGVIMRAGFIRLLEENNYNQAAVIEYLTATAPR